jgi:Arc/MetJ family transcription regulator
MRTNIEIDDDLMRQVLEITGLRTKREAVEQALQILLRLKQQEQLKVYRGELATPPPQHSHEA